MYAQTEGRLPMSEKFKELVAQKKSAFPTKRRSRLQNSPGSPFCGYNLIGKILDCHSKNTGSMPVSRSIFCGSSSMVEHESSKLEMWVRFPFPAPNLRRHRRIGISPCLRNRCLMVRIHLSAPNLPGEWRNGRRARFKT